MKKWAAYAVHPDGRAVKMYEYRFRWVARWDVDGANGLALGDGFRYEVRRNA